MKFIHVKNLEKYHAGYKDRTLLWCKLYFKILNGDPEFEMLCEIDQCRYLKLIVLELQIKRPMPLDEEWLLRKGFNFKDRSLNDTLQALAYFIDIRETNTPISLAEENMFASEERERHEILKPDPNCEVCHGIGYLKGLKNGKCWCWR